jgi:hypothetical protein
MFKKGDDITEINGTNAVHVRGLKNKLQLPLSSKNRTEMAWSNYQCRSSAA